MTDRTQPGAPASIAAIGLALAAYPVGVERAWMTRIDAIERTLALLRFFWTSPQGTAPDVAGYKGFYYHFLDMTTGVRADLCELSTVDTSFLLAGMLAIRSRTGAGLSGFAPISIDAKLGVRGRFLLNSNKGSMDAIDVLDVSDTSDIGW